MRLELDLVHMNVDSSVGDLTEVTPSVCVCVCGRAWGQEVGKTTMLHSQVEAGNM